jgi:hypothetical protein
VVTLLVQNEGQGPEDSALQYGVLQAAVDFPAFHEMPTAEHALGLDSGCNYPLPHLLQLPQGLPDHRKSHSSS